MGEKRVERRSESRVGGMIEEDREEGWEERTNI